MSKTQIDQAILNRLDLSLELSQPHVNARHSRWKHPIESAPGPLIPEKIAGVQWSPTAKKLDSMCHRHAKWIESMGSEGQQADLSGASLPDTDLSGTHLWSADLSEAYLEDADLSGAGLRSADLSKAFLHGADLSGAELQNADLSGATLPDTNLSEAELRGADLSRAELLEADLSGAGLDSADLSGAGLDSADLSGAALPDSDLSGAELLEVDLSGANLRNADLAGAALRGADLAKAALNDADLEQVEGLQVMQLRGANVSLATLPDAVGEFAGLGTAKATTQSAKKLFISVLVACAYATLAIALKTGGAEDIELPIIGLGLETESFYLVTPALLALLFGYFHLQMQRLWEELAQLPAVFPDGKPIDEKVHPWLVTGIVRAHVKRLKEKQSPPLFLLQRFVVFLLAWGTVPATLLFFAWMYPPESTGWKSLALFILTALTASGAIASYRKATGTLRLEEHHPSCLARPGVHENGVWFLKSKGFWIGVECVLLAFALWYMRLGVPLF